MPDHASSPSSRPAAPAAGWTSSPGSGPSRRCRSPASTSSSTSRCRTSRTAAITDVWLSLQFQGAALEEQVANGRPWDLDRNRGGLRLLMPAGGHRRHGRGGLRRRATPTSCSGSATRSRAAAPDVVARAERRPRLPLRLHGRPRRRTARRGAECTIVTTEVPVEEAGDHAVVEVDDDGRVTGFAYKPDEPEDRHDRDRDLRLRPGGAASRCSRSCTASSAPTATRATPGSATSATTCCPRLVERGRTCAHPLAGLLARPRPAAPLPARAPRRAHRRPGTCFDDPGWPILTRQPQRVPGRVLDGGRVVDSLLSPGARVAGAVRRSVLGPGVVVEAGRRGPRQRRLRRHAWCAPAPAWTGRSSTPAARSRPDARGRATRTPTARRPGRGHARRPRLRWSAGASARAGRRLEPGTTA